MKRKFKVSLIIFTLLISIFTAFFGQLSVIPEAYSTEIEKIDSKDTSIKINDHPIDIPFVFGMQSSLQNLDPQNSWDSDSLDVILQVCEGLFGYNYSDPDPKTVIIPYLATADGTWSPDGLNYTVPLRTGVTFHDGAPFNASAVKFTFDRLAYLMDNSMSIAESLYRVYDPDLGSNRRIINRTEIVDTYTIKFILNVPYGAFNALLCFSGSYILSPKSTPATINIDTDTGDLVGTGPFVYDGYIPNVEVNFHAYEDYWQGKADINQMKFKIITDIKQRQIALINKEVHFISDLDPDYFSVFNAIPDITFVDTGKTGGFINFLGMNNKQINVSFREAISYAIDYDYIINELREGQVERSKSPVPDGIQYANSTFDYPVLNLTHARLVMQSMGYGIGFDINDDTEWENTAVTSPFATFNYTYTIGNQFREEIFNLLWDNLPKIGIEVTGATVTISQFVYMLLEIAGYHRNMLQLYWTGWIPDINDPSNYINSLFTNRTVAYNSAQVDDWIVQQWMEEALKESDQAKREILYDKIQKRLVEEVYPLAWCTVEKLNYAHHINLTGFQQNTLGINYFYPCQWDPWYVSPRTDAAFIVGVSSGPHDIDPLNAWDSTSYQTIDQVCEGLYRYNYSDPEMEIIPNLATADGTWSPDGLNYTVPLWSGVTFHDGTLFNASAVKFTFDRLGYLTNATGTLPGSTPVSVLFELYEFIDGTPIINRTEIIDTYTIRFILNAPYAPLKALLCFSGSYILSPASTSSMDYIDTNTGDLVGTGPFVYDGYIPNVEVNFHAYDNYWRGKAEIEQMKYEIYMDNDERLAALLTKDVDFINGMPSEWVDLYKDFSNITVLDEGKTSSLYSYLGMNNIQINVSFREAISYAIDYDFLIYEIREDQDKRLKSPIPDGMRYANSTFDYPIFNITRARLVMQSMRYGEGFDIYNDTEWENAATNAPFATFNYTYLIGSQIREEILYLLQNNLAKIGINVIGAPMEWTEYLNILYDIGGYHRNMLQLFYMYWLPDFNDPSNTFNTLLLNTSIYNSAQVNDWISSEWMQDAIIETNPIQREILYDMIQKRLIEEVYPWAWCSVPKLYTAHHEDLTGFQQNAFDRLYFYTCKWSRLVPGPFVLNSDAGTPDTNGDFNLAWTLSDGAINYTVYQYDNYITAINGSLTLLANEITDLTLPLNGYSNGIYYFIVVAHNEYGDTLSNCISVVVSLPLPGAFTLVSTAGTP
ncbi:MAG: ABC transporter substrate-binding protein, partial [Promethearchaeota archaeon]